MLVVEEFSGRSQRPGSSVENSRPRIYFYLIFFSHIICFPNSLSTNILAIQLCEGLSILNFKSVIVKQLVVCRA